MTHEKQQFVAILLERMAMIWIILDDKQMGEWEQVGLLIQVSYPVTVIKRSGVQFQAVTIHMNPRQLLTPHCLSGKS